MSVVSSSLPTRTAPTWPLVYVAVALTTMATLILELSLTRIFSVVFYYHFAFLAISIALFGLALFGFDAAPEAVNEPDGLFGLRFLFSTFPSLFFLTGALIVWNYPITEARHAEIRQQIEANAARRDAPAA